MPESADATATPIPGDPSAGSDDALVLDDDEDEGSQRSSLVGWGITIGVAVVLTILLKTFILQAYSIPSESMVPTLKVGDRVVVFRLNRDPARGDIVVFDRPASDPKTSPDDPDVLIKRVIGLPGDTVEARGGKVYVNGKELVESYLPSGTETTIADPITVPSGRVLVLGDNRSKSFDGRYFGTIGKDLIVGRAVARIWPVSHIGGL